VTRKNKTGKSPVSCIWFSVAVIVLAAVISGCVDRGSIKRMQDQLNYLESAERRDRRDLDRIDSLLTENIESNQEMRADMYAALDDLRTELAAIKENILDLGTKMDRRGTDHPVVIYPSQVAPDSSGGTPVAGEPVVVDCGKLYEQALDDLRNGNYDLSIEGFEEFVRTCSSSPDLPRALHWLGQSYYTNDDFASAITVFKRAIDESSEFDLLPNTLLMLGRCYQKSDQPRHAKTYFQRLVDEFPSKPEARVAEARLKEIEEGGGG